MTYERKALLHALAEREHVDPATNAPFEGEAQLVPNHALRNSIEQWKAIQAKVGVTRSRHSPAARC